MGTLLGRRLWCIWQIDRRLWSCSWFIHLVDEGLAAAAVGWVAQRLHRDGEHSLRTACHIANEDAAAFCRTMRFNEKEDLFLAQLRRSHYLQEWERLQRAGTEEAKLAEGAHREYERWHNAETRLRERAESEGLETVMPDRLHPLR